MRLAALNERAGRPSGLPAALRKLGALLLGLFALWFFVFIFAPWTQQLSAVRPLAEYVQESDIDATALFYTETKETGDAENYLRNSFLYPPSGGDKDDRSSD